VLLFSKIKNKALPVKSFKQFLVVLASVPSYYPTHNFFFQKKKHFSVDSDRRRFVFVSKQSCSACCRWFGMLTTYTWHMPFMGMVWASNSDGKNSKIFRKLADVYTDHQSP
jgi:hypothetical protein